MIGKNFLQTLPNLLGVTFWLQLALLIIAVRSVESANWVETPPLILVVLPATLIAAIFARRPLQNVQHILAILLGLLAAYLSGIYLTQSDSLILGISEFHSRLSTWWVAVTGEDSTTDLLPLSVLLVTITWLAAYFTAWLIFKYKNVWLTLIPIVGGTIINLTYLPERFLGYLLAILFVGLLLIVHITSKRRREKLEITGTKYPKSIHRLSITHGLSLGVVILLLTALMPSLESSNPPLKWLFKPMDRSIENIRVDLHRIFAAVPGHHLASLRFFGPVLPLMRPVPTAEDIVLQSDSDFPLYWPAIRYDQYTSKAWKVTDMESKPIIAVTEGSDDEDEGGEGIRTANSIDYKVGMFVHSPYLLISGQPSQIDPQASQQYLPPKKFTLNVPSKEPIQGIPNDILGSVNLLLANISLADNGNFAISNIPSDLSITKITHQSKTGRKSTSKLNPLSPSYRTELRKAIQKPEEITKLEIQRSIEDNPAVTYSSVEATTEYRVVAELNMASESTLRDSGDYYPPDILYRYLGVPRSLPDRIYKLSRDITINTTNNYDKSVAIETFLRTLQHTTVSNIIPHDSDTIDHFLFQAGEGYSDYFASSMAVMLRTLGIPTRLVLGFGPGLPNTEKAGFIVRDLDSHSWPEVYFPDIGWIPFEPTPIYPLRPRGNDLEAFGVGYFGMGENLIEEPGPDPGPIEPEEQQEERNDFGGPLPDGLGPRAAPITHFGTPLGLGGILFVTLFILGIVIARAVWLHYFGRLDSPESAYLKLHHLTKFLGIGVPDSKTPYEFDRDLSRLVPEAKLHVGMICETFVRHRYGRITPTHTEQLMLNRSWEHVKEALLSHIKTGRDVPVYTTQSS